MTLRPILILYVSIGVLGCSETRDLRGDPRGDGWTGEDAAGAQVGADLDAGAPTLDGGSAEGEGEGVQECPDGHEWADGACHPSQSEGEGEGEGRELPGICRVLPAPEGQPPLDLATRCAVDGGPLRIRDLRDSRCPEYEALPTRFPGREVVLEEAVVTGVFGNDFTVQDPEGGAYSGLWVYDRRPTHEVEVALGDRVRLTGTVIEFFTLTELAPASIEVRAQGDVPDPVFVADPGRLSDDGDLAEAFESVLVEIHNVEIQTTVPDCPQDFGMFVVSGGLRLANEDTLNYTAARGDVLRKAIGLPHFSFDHHKFLPRSDLDLTIVACGGLPDKCEAEACPVEAEALESGALIITEIQDNPNGDDQTREFVELYNPGPGSVNIEGWRVQDCAGHTAPLAGTIPARDFHVLAASRDSSENGGVSADGLMGAFFLPNGFGQVLVFDGDDVLVDQVRYAIGDDWPERRGGQSLDLPEPAADNRQGAAWSHGERRYGAGGDGSPGARYED